MLFGVQIHGALITFLIAIQWKCEDLLGEKHTKLNETRTPQSCLQLITNNVINFDNFRSLKVPQYLLTGDLNDEADIVQSNAGNIKRILMSNEVYEHYLICANQSNSNLLILICIIG